MFGFTKNILKKFNKIRFGIVFQVFLFLVVGFTILIAIVFNSYKNNLTNYTNKIVEDNRKLYNILLDKDLQILSTTIEAVKQDESIKKWYALKNRDSLYATTLSLFESLADKNIVSHWIFYNPPPENTTFLKMHTPDNYGENVTRASFLKATESQEQAFGIELGKQDFALRLIHPYTNGEKLLGYIEIGTDISNFLKIMKAKTENEYFIFIRKDLIEEDNWKNHLTLEQKRNNWNDYENLLVIDGTEDSRYNSDILKNIKLQEITDNGLPLGITKENNKVYFNAAIPLIASTETAIGALHIKHNLTNIYKQTYRYKIVLLIAGSFTILIVLLYLFWIVTMLKNNIEQTTTTIKKLTRGEIAHINVNQKSNEIGVLQEAVNFLGQSMKKMAYYARQIGEGNLDVEIEKLGNKDLLSNSLIDMKENLRKSIKEEEKRKKIEQTESWIRKGVSEFNDLLRQNYKSINELGFVIISNMVEYLNVNQAGLFVLNDKEKDNVYLDLVAAYAYDRQKFIKRHVKPGDGLIGGVALEKKNIYIDELPNDYIKIESGLGDANPQYLYITPLLNEGELLGVIEIASFNPIEDHEQEFIEKVGHIIAISLANTKASLNTTYLLEQLQRHSEEQAAQEEELRQNLEELEATQENSRKQKQEAEEHENELLKTIAELQDEIMYLKSTRD